MYACVVYDVLPEHTTAGADMRGPPGWQAHYVQVSSRDAAMSKSLNSDYLGQLLIQVDTARLDARLVAAATEGATLPDEARALLVFKRGRARTGGTRYESQLQATASFEYV